MFGIPVSAYSQAAIGSAGYIIKVLVNSDLMNEVESVQAQPSDSSTPAPATLETTRNTLLGYLNSTSAPDLAFFYAHYELTIFFKTSVFAYTASTRFAVFGKRRVQLATNDGDYLDIPDKDYSYLINLCLRDAWMLKKDGHCPKEIKENIRDFELEIRDE